MDRPSKIGRHRHSVRPHQRRSSLESRAAALRVEFQATFAQFTHLRCQLFSRHKPKSLEQRVDHCHERVSVDAEPVGDATTRKDV